MDRDRELQAKRTGSTDTVEGFTFTLRATAASLVAQRLKHLPAMPETQVRSLGREDSLEKEFSKYSHLENPMDGGAW